MALGASVYDPTDPMGKMFFNILATFAEFESDLIRMRTREGMVTTAYAEGLHHACKGGGTSEGPPEN
nr:recombinase family protein [Octadecabacter arcticus]